MASREGVSKNSLSQNANTSQVTLVTRKNFMPTTREWSMFETVLVIVTVVFAIAFLTFAILYALEVSKSDKDTSNTGRL